MITEWRYLAGGRVAHGFTRAPAVHSSALCGASPARLDRRGWRGHGEHQLRATIVSGMRAGMAKPHAGPARGSA